MIDIITTSPPQAPTHSILSLPFDWVLLSDAPINQPWHDYSNLCQGAQHYKDAQAQSYSYALESGLHTAVIHSLFTDARAGRDDPLPYGQTDPRGWVGQKYLPQNGKQYGAYGSRLWLNYYTTATPEVLEAQRFAAQEALTWLISSEVVDRIEVAAKYVNKESGELLSLHITMWREGQAQPIYDAVWGATLNNPEGLYAA